MQKSCNVLLNFYNLQMVVTGCDSLNQVRSQKLSLCSKQFNFENICRVRVLVNYYNLILILFLSFNYIQFYMHSNLGRTLQDVCKELIDNPPTFIQYNNYPPVR